MRRKDRELNKEEAWTVVDQCTHCVISMVDENGAPYAVPMNFARMEDRIYVHCAREGYRLNCLRRNGQVCLTCVAAGSEIDQAQLTTRYASAILRGTASEVTEPKEKAHALGLLCQKLAPENPAGAGSFSGCLDRTAVWQITVETITGKANWRQ